MNTQGQTIGGKTSGETANLTGTAVTFSVLTKTGGPLSKRISLGPDGNPLSDGSACLMITGTATTVSLPFIKFGDVVETLTPQQAIALGTIQGVEIGQELPVVTVRRLRECKAPAGAISRTQDHFGLPDGPGLILIDIDLKGASPKARAAIDAAGGPFEAILTAVPALGAAPRAMRASTSAGLSNPKTDEIWPGSDGLHVYIPVQNAHDIPRSLRALHDRLALNGLGWTLLGRSGAILERSLVDVSVGSPERLIFEGAPVIEPPLIQAPRPVLMVNTDAAPLDTVTGIPDLTKTERDTLARMRGQARKDVAQDSAQRRKEWAKARGVDIAKRTKGNAKEITEQLLQSGPHDPGNPIELAGVLLLEFDDPKIGEITVSQMMADLERYTGETLADPLEGSAYGRGKAMVMGIDKSGLLRIRSFAHGGMSYFVPRRQRQKFIVSDPHNFDDIADEIADVVGRDKRLFATGGLVVEVSRTKSAIKAMRTVLRDASGEPIRDKSGEARTESAIVARSVLAPPGAVLSAVLKVATCWKHTRNGELRPVLPPHPLMTLIAAKLPTTLPPLLGVTDAPVFWDGRLITGQGYHEPTGLWLETGDLIIEPCHDLADAFVILADWLDGFWFESLIDRVVAVGVLLDLLTVKSTLMGTTGAPLTFVSGAGSGIGKSHLVSVLATAWRGKPSPVMTYPASPEEREKVLFTAMLEGHAHLPFDNFTASGSLGHGHDALMRTVSEPEGNGRILGVSGSYSGPLATKVTMTGINPDISGEMIRRTLMCRLSRSEDPDDQRRINAARKKMPNLIEWTRANRGRLLGAAERILQAPSTMSVDGYQDWACRVSGPLLASVNAAMGAEAVSEGDLIGAWLDVLEDGAGYIRKGTDKLLQNLEAQLVWHEPDTKGMSISKPFAARTILRLCDSEVIRNACFGDEADMRSVTRWLNNQVNVPVQFDKKWLEIKIAGRIALGSDTDHKARPTWYLLRKKAN